MIAKREILLILFVMVIALSGCSSVSEPANKAAYKQISQEEAKEMMLQDDGHIVVDVRRQDEYDSGHIPGAVLIPNESISSEAPEILSDYDQIILIYCRSGNRSKQAAEKLAAMGYKNIYEFGGINTWTGEIVSGTPDSEDQDEDKQETQEETEEKTMKLVIADTEVPVIWEDNDSADELKKLTEKETLTIQMSMYGGFEQVGQIGKSIVRDDKQTTTQAGDIVLYSGNQIVVFYGSNSWAYTRLGHVDLPQEELEKLLGNGDVTLKLQQEN